MLLSIPSMFPRSDKIHVVRDNETETWRSDYTQRKVGVPPVLLVEQHVPGSKILPHFHGIDQFQVFMDGEGKLGHHRRRADFDSLCEQLHGVRPYRCREA